MVNLPWKPSNVRKNLDIDYTCNPGLKTCLLWLTSKLQEHLQPQILRGTTVISPETYPWPIDMYSYAHTHTYIHIYISTTVPARHQWSVSSHGTCCCAFGTMPQWSYPVSSHISFVFGHKVESPSTSKNNHLIIIVDETCREKKQTYTKVVA